MAMTTGVVSGVPRRPITDLLHDVRNGDRRAADDLMRLVYEELRSMARARLRYGHRLMALDTSALVNEAYLKLFGAGQVDWHDRNHFFAVASRAMRQILVDHARKAGAAKRGNHVQPMPLDEGLVEAASTADEILAIDAALGRLARLDQRLAQVVELRYFVGLRMDEIATVLGVTVRTVGRDWEKARRLLKALYEEPQ